MASYITTFCTFNSRLRRSRNLPSPRRLGYMKLRTILISIIIIIISARSVYKTSVIFVAIRTAVLITLIRGQAKQFVTADQISLTSNKRGGELFYPPPPNYCPFRGSLCGALYFFMSSVLRPTAILRYLRLWHEPITSKLSSVFLRKWKVGKRETRFKEQRKHRAKGFFLKKSSTF